MKVIHFWAIIGVAATIMLVNLTLFSFAFLAISSIRGGCSRSTYAHRQHSAR